MANKSWLKHISRVPCADSRLIKSIHAAWHLTHLPDIRKQVDAQHEEEQGHGKILNSAENEKKHHIIQYSAQNPVVRPINLSERS